MDFYSKVRYAYEAIYSKAYYIIERNGRFYVMRTQNWYSAGGEEHELTGEDTAVSAHDTFEDAKEHLEWVAKDYVDMIKEGEI